MSISSLERFCRNPRFDRHLWRVIDQFNPLPSFPLLFALFPQALQERHPEQIPFQERYELSLQLIGQAPTNLPEEATFLPYFVCLSRLLTIPSNETRNVLPLFLKAVKTNNRWIFALLIKNSDLTRQLTPSDFETLYRSIPTLPFFQLIPLSLIEPIATHPLAPSVSFFFELDSPFQLFLSRFVNEPSLLRTNPQAQRAFLSNLFRYGPPLSLSCLFNSPLFKILPIDLLLSESRRWPGRFPLYLYYIYLPSHPQFLNLSLDDLCFLLARWGHTNNRTKDLVWKLTPFLTHPHLNEMHQSQRNKLTEVAQRDNWILQVVKNAPDLIPSETFDTLVHWGVTRNNYDLITAVLTLPRGANIPHSHLQNALDLAKIKRDSASLPRTDNDILSRLIHALQTHRPDFPVPPELLPPSSTKRKADVPPDGTPLSKRRKTEDES